MYVWHVFIKINLFLLENRLVFGDCLPNLPAEVFVLVQGGINMVWEKNKNPLWKLTGFFTIMLQFHTTWNPQKTELYTHVKLHHSATNTFPKETLCTIRLSFLLPSIPPKNPTSLTFLS